MIALPTYCNSPRGHATVGPYRSKEQELIEDLIKGVSFSEAYDGQHQRQHLAAHLPRKPKRHYKGGPPRKRA